MRKRVQEQNKKPFFIPFLLLLLDYVSFRFFFLQRIRRRKKRRKGIKEAE